MIFLYIENLKTATSLESPNSIPSAPMENLYDVRLSTQAQFVMGGPVMTMTLTFPEALRTNAFGFGGHNFGSGSVVSIAGVGAYPLEEVHSLLETAEADQAVYELTITDPTADPGDIRFIGRLELGVKYTPPGIGDDLTAEEVSQSTSVLSTSRQSYGYRRTTFTRASVVFPVVEDNERTEMLDFFRYVDVFVPFFVKFDEPCLLAPDNYAILEGTDTLSFQAQASKFWTTRINLAEVF